MTINEGAIFNVSMPGNAVAFQNTGQVFTAKKGSLVNLTSHEDNSIVATKAPAVEGNVGEATNSLFLIEPGAEFYGIGIKVSGPLMDYTTGNGNRLVLNQPKRYDIRNRGEGGRAFRSVRNGNVWPTPNTLEITNSDIDLWKGTTPADGTSDYSYTKVESFLTKGHSTAANLYTESSNSDLRDSYQTNIGAFRRMAGMNQNATVEWGEITDADLTLAKVARIKIGDVPDDEGLRPDGTIHYIPVYAAEGQVKVEITNNINSDKKSVSTDKEGYISFSTDSFYQAGAEIVGVAQRGEYLSDPATIIVKDVTPPTPAEIQPISNGALFIKGTSVEKDAMVTATADNKPILDSSGKPIQSLVQSDGSWTLPLTNYLIAGSVVQIFLTDVVGNKNPVADTRFHDALFLAATKATVLDNAPNQNKVTKTVKNQNGTATTNVRDVLSYSIQAMNQKASGTNINWENVEIIDVIPEGLTLQLDSIQALKADGSAVAENEISYAPTTKTLSIQTGDVKSQEEIKVTFDVVVNSKAYNQQVINTVVAKGYSSLTNNYYEAQDQVPVPGGKVNAGKPVPALAKTVKNLDAPTDNTGIVGDHLEYTLKVSNTVAAPLINLKITDRLSEMLDIQESSIKVDNQEVDFAHYDSATRTLTVDFTNQGEITKERQPVITFVAIINDKAADATITNKATGTGTDLEQLPYQIESKEVATSTKAGELVFKNYSKTMNFSDKKISSKPKEYGADANLQFTVEDTRRTKASWVLKAKMTKALENANGSAKLLNSLFFKDGKNNKTVPVTTDFTTVYLENIPKEMITLDFDKDAKEGIFLKVSPGEVMADSYTTEIEWELETAP